MKEIPIWFAALITAGMIFLTAAAIGNRANTDFGSAASGLAAFATTSTIIVDSYTDKTLFTANQNCAARIIATAGSDVRLSFHSSLNPSATVGFALASSTTYEFDSDLYGCTTVTAAAAASSTLILLETSQ